ncbi:UNVERIFIED_CONTAM: hypothetical protein HHA_462300 [Hammondia hammondi]|eukprot:XP_008885625.1 hypothetical protein HHA_462300 [Hammondia hammondi]
MPTSYDWKYVITGCQNQALPPAAAADCTLELTINCTTTSQDTLTLVRLLEGLSETLRCASCEGHCCLSSR